MGASKDTRKIVQKILKKRFKNPIALIIAFKVYDLTKIFQRQPRWKRNNETADANKKIIMFDEQWACTVHRTLSNLQDIHHFVPFFVSQILQHTKHIPSWMEMMNAFFYLFLSNEFLCSFRQTEWDPLQVGVVIYNLVHKIQRHYWIYKTTESIRMSTTESIRTATFVTHIMNIANRLYLSNSFSAWLTGFVGWFCFFLTSTIFKYLLVKYKFYLRYECVRCLMIKQIAYALL